MMGSNMSTVITVKEMYLYREMPDGVYYLSPWAPVGSPKGGLESSRTPLLRQAIQKIGQTTKKRGGKQQPHAWE
jgi:hypothetical protein